MAGRDYPERPVVGVGAVVFKDDHVLMVRRGHPPFNGEWSLPGGGQEVGETVADAACREVLEETGVTIETGPMVDVIDCLEPDGGGRTRYHYTIIDLLARWQAGTPAAADDVTAAEWVALDALAGMEMWSETRRIILKAAAMRAGDALFARPG